VCSSEEPSCWQGKTPPVQALQHPKLLSAWPLPSCVFPCRSQSEVPRDEQSLGEIWAVPDCSSDGEAFSEDVALFSVLLPQRFPALGALGTRVNMPLAPQRCVQARVRVWCGSCTDPGWLLSPVMGAVGRWGLRSRVTLPSRTLAEEQPCVLLQDAAGGWSRRSDSVIPKKGKPEE